MPSQMGSTFLVSHFLPLLSLNKMRLTENQEIFTVVSLQHQRISSKKQIASNSH